MRLGLGRREGVNPPWSLCAALKLLVTFVGARPVVQVNDPTRLDYMKHERTQTQTVGFQHPLRICLKSEN